MNTNTPSGADVLLPCPFCGNEEIRIVDDLVVSYAECMNCGSSASVSSYRDGAIATWNRRSALSFAQEDREDDAVLPEGYTLQVIEALNENGDPVSVDAAEEIQRLLGLVTAPPKAQPMSEWQPIETAPKDGSRVLLFWPVFGNKEHQEFGFWDVQPYNPKPKPFWSGDLQRVYGVKWYRGYAPTHWKPLPAPPEAERHHGITGE